MRPIAQYVADLRALGRAIHAISAEDACDDGSAWYDVYAVLERSAPPTSLARASETTHFDSQLLECSGGMPAHLPGDWASLPYRERMKEQRAAAIEFGQAVAATLGVPCYVNPPQSDRGPHVDWLEQELCSRL